MAESTLSRDQLADPARVRRYALDDVAEAGDQHSCQNADHREHQ